MVQLSHPYMTTGNTISSVQFSSVAQSCLTLCDPINCSKSGLPVHHQLSEFTQTHVHRVSDVMKLHPVMLFFCPQSFPASGSFQMSPLSLLGVQSVGASALASVFPINIQDRFPWGWMSLISLLSKSLSRVFSSTTIWKHQLFSNQPASWSNSHIRTWALDKA